MGEGQGQGWGGAAGGKRACWMILGWIWGSWILDLVSMLAVQAQGRDYYKYTIQLVVTVPVTAF